MKKLFLIAIAFFLSLQSSYAALDFLWLLENKGIDTQSLLIAPRVSRNTVAELLNIVDCQDCHRPSLDMQNALSPSRWDSFRLYPWNNFDDVQYNTSLDRANNYYCIAYVWNQWYMNWFPRSTSPVCSWKFCWQLDITNADVIQTVFNITSKYYYNQYTTDWNYISQWIQSQADYVQRYFDVEDRGIIETAKKSCTWWSCQIASVEQLWTYTKYCTFEPERCGMQEFAFARVWQWPIAEMNILVQQWIFTTVDVQKINFEDFAKWWFIVDIIGRVKQRAQCIDDNDNDDDAISDYQDNCYLIFNPSQSDTDKDGIWDVCDEDVDNDSIRNPLWILDDNWNVVYDNILNADNISKVLGLAIDQKWVTEKTYDFTTKYQWELTNFVWYFGDGWTAKWITATHIYPWPWVYTVRLVALDKNWKEVEAVSTVIIGAWWSNVAVVQTTTNNTTTSLVGTNATAVQKYQTQWPRASLMPSKLVQTVWEATAYKITYQWIKSSDIDYVKIAWWDWRVRELRWNDITSFTDTYPRVGQYTIQWTMFLQNWLKLPLGAFVTVNPPNGVTRDTIDNCLVVVNKDQKDDDNNRVWNACDIGTNDRVWLVATAKQTTDTRFSFFSTFTWSLRNFVWYFGDRNTDWWQNTTHTYREPWTYTVRVEATTPTWKIVSASTSVTVRTTNSPINQWWIITGTPTSTSIRASLVPSKLVQTVGERVQYSIQLTNLRVSDITYVLIVWWDWRTRQLRWQDILSFADAFTRFGWFPIGGTIYLADGRTLTIGSFVTVIGLPMCFGNNAWNWLNKCDIDDDTIPDMCDSDIDGDWASNPQWLIRFEKSDCTYDATNTTNWRTYNSNLGGPNPTTYPDWSSRTWWNTPSGGPSDPRLPIWRDNCPFTANPDQWPCRNIDKDSDDDGIPDWNDLCSLLPESFNGVNDTDWCPETDVIINFPPSKVKPWVCNACPCQYAANDSDIAPWDRVKAVLFDNATQKPVAESSWYIIP